MTAPPFDDSNATTPSHVTAEGAISLPGAAPMEAGAGWREGVHEWIREHDHRWLFVIVYLGLAVVLSVFVSLFWLVFMAVIHLALECVRHARFGWSARDVVSHSLWEVKLDFALVLLALGAVVYVDVVLGILGIQSAARAAAVTRAGARSVSRVAAWERNIRTFLLTADEMFRIGRAVSLFWARRRGRAPVQVAEPEDVRHPWRRRWGVGDRVSIGIAVACLALIAGAPLLTHHSWSEVVAVLLQELRPLPS